MAVTFTKSDLQYLLQQIQMAETNTPPVSPHLAFGIREVAGTNNNQVPGQGTFGAADQTFAQVTQQYFRTVNVDGTMIDPNPGIAGDFVTYATTAPGAPQVFGTNVVDAAPRIISNLISDISANNPAALQAAQDFGAQLGDGYTVFSSNPAGLMLPGADGVFGTADDLWGIDGIQGTADDTAAPDLVNPFIGNITPDAGLSAPFNNWMTFFGQFFDHGLDLITKGSQGTVLIPLAPDDPLILVGKDGIANTGDELTNPQLQFMALTRATNVTTAPGADGIVGTADDIHTFMNTTTPFVDQNQTYSSHASHQVFLREYVLGIDGKLHTTGSLLKHAAGVDNIAGNADDNSGMATWSDVKANAEKFGLILEDKNVGNVPIILADAYGNYAPDANGHLQISVKVGANIVAFSLDPNNKLTIDQINTLTGGQVQFTDHAFINDMAAAASPFDAQTGLLLAQDADSVTGLAAGTHVYDNELLDAHYIAGDGRVNENIALTTVHAVFHDEHNRLVEQIKTMVRAELANGDTAFASEWVLAGALTDGIIQDNEWNGERIFQAAKFGTETQYQHLVFEEFARKVAPSIPLFGNVDIHLDPAITSEFANAVYRFGHSMLDENVPIFQTNADGSMVIGPDGQPMLTDMGLIQAFTNPLAFANLGADGAQQIVQGTTHQIGSEIDEFVTGSLRNNLLGLPLDLAALNIARGRDTGVAPLNLVRAQIYDATNDQTLKPYSSWTEFGQFLKHEASLINFVAAYGQHSSILSATTLAAKRAAALDLVTMGNDPASASGDALHQDAYNFMHSLGAWANNTRVAGGDAKLNTADDTWSGGVNSAKALMNIDPGLDGVIGTSDDTNHAAMWATGSVTGVDTIDLWIGGLAEKQNLFGGLLGSTFDFIFETQLQNLQNGDRLYYLPRIEGMDFGFQIENNSFAEMIMANTGAKHLPAAIFLTPEYTVEAKDYFRKDIVNFGVGYTVDGEGFVLDPQGHRVATDSSTWLKNPVTGAQLVEVLPDGTVHFIGDDNFFGNTMVLGGTEGDDRLQAGHADDDTVWGDGGNDWIDGGNGNDQLFGGTGNDTIVDSAGDDIIHGEDGADWINGGIGDDIIFGGDGNDYIETGNAILGDEAQGGAGNDVLIGGNSDDTLIGQEGDDWLEGGDGGDGLVGDTGAPTGQVPLYAGNDVLDGGATGDKMVGFSGDDIMLGEGGFDKFNGLLGFDWADFEKEKSGVSLDMERREFIPNQQQLAGDAVRDFFVETEAASGTKFDDFIQGTENSGAAAGVFNELTNVDLIFNLNLFFANGVAKNFAPDSLAGAATNPLGINPLGFNNGNILLGGDGNDIITGRGGNDIIDGDAWLHVDLQGRGTADPTIVREIRWDITDGDVDTAVFRDVMSNYSISFTPDADGFYTITHNATIAVGGGLFVSDGTDKVRNIERLQFADQTINIGDGPVFNALPTGSIVITDDDANAATPVNATVGTALVATTTVTDADGIAPNTIHFQWQQQMITAGGGLQWVNIANTDSLTFTPTNAYLGNALRVVETFIDNKGFHEMVTSAPTALLAPNLAVNTAPFVVQQQNPAGLPDTGARTGVPINLFLPITTTFGDNETASANLIYTAKLANGAALSTVGLTFTLVPDGAGGVSGANITGTVNVAGPISITVVATDAGTPGSPGTALSVTDTFIINVTNNGGAPFFADPNPVTLNGALEDTLFNGSVPTAQDPTNDALAYKLVAGSATNGTVSLNNNGTFTFLASPDFAGTASFKYYAFDGLLKSTEKTVNINVAPVDDGTAPAVLTGEAGAGGHLSAILGFDPDGDIVAGSEHYQWLRDGIAIAGPAGTVADYAVQASDIGHNISVEISYTDGQGNINDGAPGHLAPTVSDSIFIGDVSVTGVVGANAPQMQQLSTLQDPDGGIIDALTTLVWETSSDNGATWQVVPAAQISADTKFFNPAGTTGAAGRLVRVTSTYTDGNGSTNTVNGSAVHYIVDAITGTTIAGTAALDLIFGNGGNDLITAAAGDDFVLGGAGNDTFFASAGDGNDTYDGGTNTANGDTYDMGATSDDTNVDLTNTNDLLVGGTASSATTGTDRLFRMENVVGSSGNNIITGSSVANRLSGGAGDDTLDGGTAGADVLIGGIGNDTYIVSHAGMTLTETNGTVNGIDTVQSSLTFTLANNFENLTLTGTGNINGTGNTAANVIIGNSGNNTLNGDDGNDIMTGGAGNDTLNGGNNNDTFIATINDGNDTYNGGAGTDVLDMSAATNSVTVELNNTLGNLFFARATGADIGNDVLSGFLAQSSIETFIGGAGNDTFNGRTAAGANAVSFVGGGGSDTFVAGNSVETLTGGIGNDIFQYLTTAAAGTGAGRSVITDFHHAQGDIIDLTSIDANSTVNGNQDFTFIGNAAFSDSTAGAVLNAGQIRWQLFDSDGNGSLDSTLIQGNVDNNLGADFEILLRGYVQPAEPTLVGLDFHL